RLTWFRNFVGSYRVNHPGVIVYFIPDDNNVLARGGVPEFAWAVRACAIRSRNRIIKKDLVYFVGSETVLLYVIDISTRLIVPDNCRIHSLLPDSTAIHTQLYRLLIYKSSARATL